MVSIVLVFTYMRLLIVEDEERLAKTLQRGLESKGYAVDWLAESDKALQRVLMYRNEYDLIILDLMLPGMDGQALTKAIREEEIMIPIIILTARNETENKVALLNTGADDYMVKPFSFLELLARINSVLRRPTEVHYTTITVGPLEMDTATRTVRRDGQEIPLTLKEFALLERFMREPGVVLSRETLFDHVWDFNTVAWSNVLDVHIKNLRKKINHGKHPDLLETIRGVGYRFSVPVHK